MIKVSEQDMNEFHKRVRIAMERFPQLRYGQAIFNEACGLWPDEVNKIRGTNDDCFYQDAKVKQFLGHFEVSYA